MARRPAFLPRFRSGLAVESKDVPSAAAEQKVILSSYYAALAGAGITLPGAARSKPWPVERAVTEGYERVVWCFKPVQVISGNSARLPYVLKEGDQEVDDHPLYRVLNVRANPLETAQVFRKRLSAQVLLSKRGAFVEVTMSNGQTVNRLDLLPPGRTRPVPGTGNDPISHFEVTPLNNEAKREIDVEKVRWIRDPHPIDPYGAITPLEAAGLSIELDYFARLYNVSFMKNDGRPGGILGIKPPENGGGEIDEDEMDRLESRFGRGPVEAGKLSVISGDLSYVDVAARPRDLQYAQTSKNAKTEMLVAFGVPESQLGNAADRTFANAGEEGYAFWTQTMTDHNSIILSGFHEDSEDGLKGYFDTSEIEVLQRPLIAKREEARAEVAAGLRSRRSYAVLSGLEDEVEDNALNRALWVPSGTTPIPASEADAEEIAAFNAPPEAAPQEGAASVDPLTGEPVGPDGQPLDPAADAGGAPAGNGQPEQTPVAAPAPVQRAPRADASLFADAAFKGLHAVGETPPHRRVVLAVSRETKADDDAGGDSSTLDEQWRSEVEAEVAAALDAIRERMVARATARLRSPRERKGTRHWTPEFEVDTRVGEKALDAAKIAGEGEEPEEETAALRLLLEAAAARAAGGLITDLTGKATVPSARVLRSVQRAVTATMRLVAKSIKRQRGILADKINLLDQEGSTVDEIAAALEGTESTWAGGLAVQATTATLEGAREAAAASLAAQYPDIARSWLSKRDEFVRHTHEEADGQKRDVGEPFIVGDALLRYPGDPLAPLRETANCRCQLRYRSKASGKFVAVPREERSAS